MEEESHEGKGRMASAKGSCVGARGAYRYGIRFLAGFSKCHRSAYDQHRHDRSYAASWRDVGARARNRGRLAHHLQAFQEEVAGVTR